MNNAAIRISLLDFNEKVMAGREASRREMFLLGEKETAFAHFHENIT